jgi:hypothetical protein
MHLRGKTMAVYGIQDRIKKKNDFDRNGQFQSEQC